MPMPAAMASSGERKRTARAAQPNLARVRRDEAEQHAHQGRLAGPVLAHHPVDLAALDREVDLIVGEQAAVALDDADGFDLGHGSVTGCYFAIIGSAILIEPSTI